MRQNRMKSRRSGLGNLPWSIPALLLLPLMLWFGFEITAVAEQYRGDGVAPRGLEESDVSDCLFAWTSSAAVSRGRFTRRVDRASREPVDQVCRLEGEARRIYYFSDLHQQMGAQIYHLWEYQGKEMAKVALGKVKGPRWRVWSSKSLIPGWHGTWVVKVVNQEGEVLHQDRLYFGE